MIFALNNITNGLEFMREEEVRIMPKTVFLTVSFLIFFALLFALGNRHAKAKCVKYNRFCLQGLLIGLVFALLMFLLRNEMTINIAISVVFVFALFGMIYWYGRKVDQAEG